VGTKTVWRRCAGGGSGFDNKRNGAPDKRKSNGKSHLGKVDPKAAKNHRCKAEASLADCGRGDCGNKGEKGNDRKNLETSDINLKAAKFHLTKKKM